MQNIKCEETLDDIQMTTSCAGPIEIFTANQTCTGGPITVLGPLHIFCLGVIATPVGNQSLHLKQISNARNDQKLTGDQMVTFSKGQTLGGGYQLVGVAHPGLIDLPASHLIQEQTPEISGNLHINSCPLQKQPQRLKPYVCEHRDCGKSYWRSAQLQVHQRTHSGQKPYACDAQGCQWRFNRSDELKRHMRRHTGERPYSCNICKKSFARADHVTQHLSVHR